MWLICQGRAWYQVVVIVAGLAAVAVAVAVAVADFAVAVAASAALQQQSALLDRRPGPPAHEYTDGCHLHTLVVCCMSLLLVRNWYNVGTSHHTVRRTRISPNHVDSMSHIYLLFPRVTSIASCPLALPWIGTRVFTRWEWLRQVAHGES